MRDPGQFQESLIRERRRLERWRKITGYLLRSLRVFHQRIIPPGEAVFQPRCGTGDMIASVAPREALGLEPDGFFAEICRTRHPEIEILEQEVVTAVPERRFNYAIACHLLEQEDECLKAVESICEWLCPRGKLVFTFMNPVWVPLVGLFIKLGLRPKDRRYNYLTAKDVSNLCELAGCRVIEEGYKVFCPLPIPVVAHIINTVLPRIPVIRNLGLMGYVIARVPSDPHRPEPSVTVVIPCHNEQENVAECITRVPSMGSRTEILVVDDGSSDRTADIVREKQEKESSLRLISYSPRRGKAHAVREGFRGASGDIVMILDADMAVLPEELVNFYRALAADRAEFINGTRMLYPQEVGACTIWRLIGNKLFGILFSILIGQRCTDTLCGTKALYKEDADKIKLTGRGWGDFDLLFGVASRKLHMLELPVHYQERKAGQSKMRFFRDGIQLALLCARASVRLP